MTTTHYATKLSTINTLESQVNIQAHWKGIGYDQAISAIESQALANETGKHVVLHWVDNHPTENKSTERQWTFRPMKAI